MEKHVAMRVLIVTHNYLSGFGGGAYGARAYINAFAALYDDITLLFPAHSEDESIPEIAPHVRMTAVTDTASKVRKAARQVFRGVLHRFEQSFSRLLETDRFDMVVFQNSKCSSRLIRKARKTGARTVVIHDNYEWEYTRDNTPLLQLPLFLPAVVRTERTAVREADLNLALTPEDADQLVRHYGKGMRGRMELLGAFEYRPIESCPVTAEDTPVFAITGNLGARQASDSLIPWFSEYYPLLKREIPDAKLIVAGKDPGTDLKQLLSRLDVELVDTPPDMSVILRRARYYLCPVQLGGGVKLRVMDGLRTGLPALVHRVSARGYEALEGISLFVYDTPDSFVESLRKMLACPGSAMDRQQVYKDRFSFEAGVKRLRNILNA